MKKHKVIDAVQQHFGIDPSLRTRRREVVDTRQAIMVALRNYYNLKEISDMFTFKVRKDGEVSVRTMNHATVLHATREHALKYNDNPERRFRHYELYCNVYDFCTSYLKSEPYRPITQEQMRREIETFKHLRDEAERNLQQVRLHHEAEKQEFKAQVKELSKQNKALEKQVRDLTNERNKIKAAFTALYKEKKAKAELNK